MFSARIGTRYSFRSTGAAAALTYRDAMASRRRASSGEEPRSTEPLAAYGKKRDFTRTPEPGPAVPEKPAKRRSQAKPRFVVQEHHARRLHWDLRLEHEQVLWSWAVPKGIPMRPSTASACAASTRCSVHAATSG